MLAGSHWSTLLRFVHKPLQKYTQKRTKRPYSPTRRTSIHPIQHVCFAGTGYQYFKEKGLLKNQSSGGSNKKHNKSKYGKKKNRGKKGQRKPKQKNNHHKMDPSSTHATKHSTKTTPNKKPCLPPTPPKLEVVEASMVESPSLGAPVLSNGHSYSSLAGDNDITHPSLRFNTSSNKTTSSERAALLGYQRSVSLGMFSLPSLDLCMFLIP